MLSVRLEYCDSSLLLPVSEVLSDLGIVVARDADVSLSICKGDDLSVSGKRDAVNITYREKVEVFRALSMIERFIESGDEIREKRKYSMLTYYADESRNAVNNVGELKVFIRTLAVMGYDSLMLYTEDTFELREYKYFGHQRGRYSEEELMEIDAYSDLFGIELIPSVQTLAHLACALRWQEFAGFSDDPDTLLVGDERTYDFIRAELEFCKRCFRTNKIHIGMDEAVNLGRGNYLTKNGYRPSSIIMVEHLERVLSICRELGFSPMMWSDTFFREILGDYYVKEGSFSEEFIARIPKDVAMTYWDYYHDDPELLDHMMKLHCDMGCEVIFAGGSRKWDGFATNNARSLVCSAVQLDFCDKYGIDKIIMTAWGDCGAEASLYSALSGALYYAERCYSNKAERDLLNRRSLECFDTKFDTLLSFDLPNKFNSPSWNYTSAAKYLLFNDPLERIMDMHMNKDTVAEEYREHARVLHTLSEGCRFGYALKTLAALCDVLVLKSDLGWRIYDAYKAGDKASLLKISEEIPSIIEKLDVFLELFRAQWYRENKTFGFTLHEYRIGGLATRLRSVESRLRSFVSGKIEKIEELEYEPLPIDANSSGKYIGCNSWVKFSSAAIWE